MLHWVVHPFLTSSINQFLAEIVAFLLVITTLRLILYKAVQVSNNELSAFCSRLALIVTFGLRLV